ncbi:MAG: hypothetical protein AAB649_03235, partial [Patescibacteria group bacterium]
VALYKKDPLYGVLFNKSLLGEIIASEQEISIRAVPFFFGVDDANSASLKYEWNLNGEAVNSSRNEVTLRKPSGSNEGQAILSLQISNTIDYFQFGSAQLLINLTSSTN